MRGRLGFTLVELVVSLSLFLLCFSLCLPLVRLQREVWGGQEEYREEFDALASAMTWVVRDLQEAGYRCDGPPLREVEEELLTYILSRDESGSPSRSGEHRRLVSVYRDGRDLMYRTRRWNPDASRWERGSVQKLASGVEGLSFRALARGGGPVADPGEAAAVEIELRGRRAGKLSGFVTLRNGRGGGRE